MFFYYIQMTGQFERNPGIPFNFASIPDVEINRSAVNRRAATHEASRGVKVEYQLAWLLRLVTLIDLTTLAGDDDDENVRRLCEKAKRPIRQDLLKASGLEAPLTTGAVCVYPRRVPAAAAALKGSNIPLASVATGFPAGQIPLPQRLEEIKDAVANGATEIDIVISREQVLTDDWAALYDEIVQMRQACGEAHLKTILATGELRTYKDIYMASYVCMMGGADFIKTSTGKEKVNATLPVGLIMMRAIRDYYQRTGFRVGLKPAGGIATAKAAISWLSLVMEELGDEWTHNGLFRIGASSLLGDIERQIDHCLNGAYGSKNYYAMA